MQRFEENKSLLDSGRFSRLKTEKHTAGRLAWEGAVPGVLVNPRTGALHSSASLNNGPFVCQVSLGKVLKAIVVMRSLFIDRTIVRGFSENIYSEDGKVSWPLCVKKQ